MAEILIAEGHADTEAKEKNGRQAPLHLCGMNGYAKVSLDLRCLAEMYTEMQLIRMRMQSCWDALLQKAYLAYRPPR